MDEEDEMKAELIGNIVDAMPSEMDLEFMCNLIATMILAYRLEDDIGKIFAGTVQCAAEMISYRPDVMIH